jgi:hypothetical protein
MVGTRILDAALCGALLVSGVACDSAPRHDANAAGQAEKSVPPATDCADHLAYRIEQASFAASPTERFPAARLEDLRRRAGRAFTAAANDMCARKSLAPAVLRQIREVRIETGAGATETAVYDDPETGPETLFFQYIFAEADLALPDRANIQAGIMCWKEPARAECQDRGD